MVKKRSERHKVKRTLRRSLKHTATLKTYFLRLLDQFERQGVLTGSYFPIQLALNSLDSVEKNILKALDL